jgi:hypothetical protein
VIFLKKSVLKLIAATMLIAGVAAVAAGSAHVDKQQVADPGQTRPGG